jgi:GntR family transcriptional regulator / MocR family aminotransferase
MLIPLKLVRDQPLQQQLYEQLLDLIASARLASGTRMPSTRMLADQFSVSRITVLLTYERLIAEGYLTTIPAKGTFVSHAPAPLPARSASRIPGDSADVPLSAGRPDARLFPAGRWRALMRDTLEYLGASLAADHPDGDPALRRAVAQWLSTSRGLAADPDQIILANGRQSALHIVTHLLLRPGTQVVIEQPCDPRAEALIASTGATVIRIPVDEDGIQTDLLPDGPVAMALVTPEHQRPLGAVMSDVRRHNLLAWAERSGATLVADDVDGELRYENMDSPQLMSLDCDSRVIHLGGFALSLGPGVHFAYLAVPRRLIATARAASRLIDDHAGRLEATALANLLDSGTYARHLHQLRKVYLGRRDSLMRSLRRHFGADVRIGGHTGGLHFVWHIPHRLGHAREVAALARGQGLDAVSFGHAALLMGFGAPDESHMDRGVFRLAEALASPRIATKVALAGE